MLRTYLKTAWRDIAFNKLYSGLNIAGLAIGMAVALLIGLWVYDQCNYDRFVPGYQQAYQVKYNFSDNGGIETQSDVAIPLAAALKNDIPEIAYTALGYGPAPYGNNTDILQVGDKKISPTGMVAGADFLKIIQLPVLKGNVDKALNDYNDIVITESLAKSLFGDTDPIGKTILISNGWNTRVTAVLKALPPNSTLQFDYITPWMAFENGWVKMASTNCSRLRCSDSIHRHSRQKLLRACNRSSVRKTPLFGHKTDRYPDLRWNKKRLFGRVKAPWTSRMSTHSKGFSG